MRDSVLGRLPLPGHCTDSGLKHSRSLSVKESRSFGHRTSLRYKTLPEATEVLSGDVGWGIPSFFPPFTMPQLNSFLTERSLHNHLEP